MLSHRKKNLNHKKYDSLTTLDHILHLVLIQHPPMHISPTQTSNVKKIIWPWKSNHVSNIYTHPLCPALVSRKRVRVRPVSTPSGCTGTVSSPAPCVWAATRSSSPRTADARLWGCCLRPTWRTSRPRPSSSPLCPSTNKPISFIKQREKNIVYLLSSVSVCSCFFPLPGRCSCSRKFNS